MTVSLDFMLKFVNTVYNILLQLKVHILVTPASICIKMNKQYSDNVIISVYTYSINLLYKFM